MMKYLRIGFKMGLSPRNVDDPLPQHTPPPPESASYHMQGTDQPFEVSDSRMAEALGIPSSPSPPCPQSPSMWGDSPRVAFRNERLSTHRQRVQGFSQAPFTMAKVVAKKKRWTRLKRSRSSSRNNSSAVPQEHLEHVVSRYLFKMDLFMMVSIHTYVFCRYLVADLSYYT
ncbi:hypothetical protein CYMTET_9039 [Cymbomonas tetramitiformis]|uniref:Uncharacterized protein n=1 Tax=Cymbomonas tetramitiformis TaxID=36881 RepID=A0AAE0LFW7_9CHLO|nr:hypothetical protein CYMTET_9039 [Cymbomonas tetramitiformis]